VLSDEREIDYGRDLGMTGLAALDCGATGEG
jgi:hypothetical protein